jgi:formate-dependent phosphoribosylglycinamide formyltransferase (GAR transformylase)
MHVIFVEPSFPRNQREFVRGLVDVGARVTAIGEAPAGALDTDLKRWLAGYEQVPSVCHEGAMESTVRRIQARGWVDRLEATVEAHILPVAKVREACTIPGTTVQTAFLCRDKPAMKEALRRAGVPCAQSAGVSSPQEARAFAARVGYPIIVKPRAGAGAAGTERVDSDAELEGAILRHAIDRGTSVAMEEFIEGHEGFYDTICVDGRVVHEFISHYYPRVLDAMRSRSVAPYLITTNRLDAPSYGEVKALGAKVIAELGISTSAVHMEWFFGAKGLKFSEIGCRPPGVSVWDIYSAANDMDLYREWAMAIVHGKPSAAPSRRYAGGMIALRPDRDGKIARYEGHDEVLRTYGEWIIDAHFPPPGTRTQPVEGGYMANAWLRMRHPDYDELRTMLEAAGRTIRVRAVAG